MPEINERLDALQKQVSELMDFKAKVERRYRLSKLYPLLQRAFDGIWLTKEFEGNKPDFYCPYCLRNDSSLEPLILGVCRKCGNAFKAQREVSFVSVSPPDDI